MSTAEAQNLKLAVVPARKKGYPFWLGGVAASIAASVTHPLDLTKVRLQTSEGKGMVSVIKHTVQTYGIRGLYDGLTGTLLRQMTYSLMRFAVYEDMKVRFHPEPTPPPAWKMAAAGSVAGGVAGVLGNPAELMMVRMQADRGKPPENRYNYRNSVQGLYRMVREEGISSWFRGVLPNAIRSILMNASQLGAYDWFKHSLLATKKIDDGPVLHFLSSVGAGTVATLVCSPADVMKSRIMNAKGKDSLLSVIRSSVAKEGPGVFFKGAFVSWTRLQPTTILIFMTYEQLKGVVDWYRAKA